MAAARQKQRSTGVSPHTTTTMASEVEGVEAKQVTTEPAAAAAENTTRICMKNVPTSFDEKRLEQHILQSAASSSSARQTKIVITDCKILKTKDGKTRKLAFLGFKTPSVRTVRTKYCE
eukprot:scaffold29670_cov55-Attheya_sp.AAC.5